MFLRVLKPVQIPVPENPQTQGDLPENEGKGISKHPGVLENAWKQIVQ